MNWLVDAMPLIILGAVQMIAALVLGMVLLRRDRGHRQEGTK